MPKPIIFLAFANDRVDTARYLRDLPAELAGIRDALQKAKRTGLCEVVELANVTVKQLLDTFQEYGDRIAVFHYGGHADGYQLLLEPQAAVAGTHHGLPANRTAHGGGLVSFLAKQKGLELIFFNGCSTGRQARELVAAGVPAVIGTNNAIADGVATDLAVRFYNGLAEQKTIARAYQEAVDEIKIKKGGNIRGMYREEVKEGETTELPWEIYENESNLLSWRLKNQNEMLAQELFSGLLSTYEGGGMEFLKSVGIELTKGLATDTLKNLGEKVLDFFKGKKEAEKELKLLKHAANEQDKDDFKAQSETVLALLTTAVEKDPIFAGEVKAIVEGLDEKTQKDLAETSEKIVKNIANIKGNNNTVIQGNTSSQIHIGNKIKRQINVKGDYHENKDKNPDENKTS